VDLKQDKVREKVMQDFERYKTHFKSKIRIRMKKGTYTMTTEDGSMVTAWAWAETASNASLVTASINGLRAATTSKSISASFTSSFLTSYNKKRIHNRIQSIKVDLKQDKVR
jgi:hypothetical protein